MADFSPEAPPAVSAEDTSRKVFGRHEGVGGSHSRPTKHDGDDTTLLVEAMNVRDMGTHPPLLVPPMM